MFSLRLIKICVFFSVFIAFLSIFSCSEESEEEGVKINVTYSNIKVTSGTRLYAVGYNTENFALTSDYVVSKYLESSSGTETLTMEPTGSSVYIWIYIDEDGDGKQDRGEYCEVYNDMNFSELVTSGDMISGGVAVPVPGKIDVTLDKGYPSGERGLTVAVAISPLVSVSGILYCDIYKSNDHFTSAADWSKSIELTNFSGIQEVFVEIPKDEILDSVYIRTWLDEDTDGIVDDDEYYEYYGNVAKADLTENGGRGAAPFLYNDSDKADIILDKKVNSLSHQIPSDGIEINAYFPEPAGDWLICLGYKGSGGSVWKAQDWTLDPVLSIPDVPVINGKKTFHDCTQSVFANGGIITYAINNSSIGAESGVYFCVRSSSSSTGSAPQNNDWFEYYNNKNINQAQVALMSKMTVGTSMDVILDVKYNLNTSSEPEAPSEPEDPPTPDAFIVNVNYSGCTIGQYLRLGVYDPEIESTILRQPDFYREIKLTEIEGTHKFVFKAGTISAPEVYVNCMQASGPSPAGPATNGIFFLEYYNDLAYGSFSEIPTPATNPGEITIDLDKIYPY